MINIRIKKGGGIVEERKNAAYNAPELKIVSFGTGDVIVTSGPIGGDGSPDYDDTAWA